MPYNSYLEQKTSVKALAKTHGMEIIRVKATFELTYSNGSDVQKIERENTKPDLFDLLRNLYRASSRVWLLQKDSITVLGSIAIEAQRTS